MANITNNDNIIDSRDVIANIDELECEITNYQDDIQEHGEQAEEFEIEIEELTDKFEVETDDAEISIIKNNKEAAERDVEEIKGLIALIMNDIGGIEEELNPIKEFADKAENYSADWNRGATLIREDYFYSHYAQELCEYETGEIPSYIVIDWEATADNLLQDYTGIELNGVTYYIR